MEKEQDNALDAGLTDLLFDVTIYIYVGDVLEVAKKLGFKKYE